MVIEVIVQSVADAVEAEAGGADRLELVRALEEDGLTPPVELISAVRQSVQIPIFVMIRPRNHFILQPGELEELSRQVRAAVQAGADGIVSGYVDGAGWPDREALATVRAATGTGVGLTFHRAFDRLADPNGALPLLAEFGVERILTSGGAATAIAGRAALQDLVPAAAQHGLKVMAGGGLTPENIAALMPRTGISELHFGTGVRVPPAPGAPVARERVAAARRAALRTSTSERESTGPG